MTELQGTVVVTGAAQGLGRALARAFADAGAEVVAADLAFTDHPGDGIRHEICDVSDEDAVEALADRSAARSGGIDVWVNNAGITRPAMLTTMSVDDFDRVMAVHARGTFLGMRAAATRMIAADRGGAILNLTSAAGLAGTIGQVNYSAAKGAIAAMTKSGAKELARYRIRVNAVAPSVVTPMTETLRTNEKLRDRFLARVPMGRLGEPEEIVGAFLFLASSRAAFVTGQVLCVDGGLHMAS
ncbi:MAG: SDR family oxidoreductase [Acidimicrobiia bacterium]|nr:SDR family oxidoreductase [Acidimicrobiia bacterium]